MNNIRQNLLSIIESIPAGVELVAVSKFHPPEAIATAYEVGQRSFGESRANELAEKAISLPNDINWHFIGHLQTNKVRRVLQHATLIHSIDSERLLRLVDSEAAKAGRTIEVLLQVHVAKEETKFGFAPEELIRLIDSGIVDELQSVNIAGIMGMASNVDDTHRIEADFKSIRATFEALKTGRMAGDERFRVVSMGMSDDYRLAIDCGSNMIRIGTTIFGVREY